MADTIEPDRRTAPLPKSDPDGGVTLINKFVVPPGRDAAFRELWGETSRYFRAQPGFLSLRLHRAVSPDAQYRYVNVARWASLAEFQAAHATDEFRNAVRQPGWAEFPSNPTLYEAVVEVDADARIRGRESHVSAGGSAYL
jgi:heme-degrading monooxygenase HmoA